MITRRAAIGAGLLSGSGALVPARGSFAGVRTSYPAPRTIEALLVDSTVAVPSQLAAFVKLTRPDVPIRTLDLDAASHAGLARLLSECSAVAGLSSGAGLFCLEQIAWDHGFRVTARTEQNMDDAGKEACRQDIAAFLAGVRLDENRHARARVVRPSRVDGFLHVWVIEKAGSRRRPSVSEAV